MKAIVAMAPNRVIGREGKLPWHFSEDLRWFKKATLGHGILMGRKTFDSLGKPLPGRLNFVVSRQAPKTCQEGVIYIQDIADFDPAKYPVDEIFVIGGGEIYRELLPRCEEIWVTRINQDFPGDTFFPPFEDQFQLKEILLKTPDFEVQRFVR